MPRKNIHGYQDASRDPETIKGWWTEFPLANIAIATGVPSNLLVLDVDPKNGGDESLKELEKQIGPLPKTVIALTGGGGEHYYFILPVNAEIKNSIGKLGPGLDIKTTGGYVVAEPSIHQNGRPYVYELDHHPEDTTLADVPVGLLDLLRQPPKEEYLTVPEIYTHKTTRYGRRALREEAEKIIYASFGEQEMTLNVACLKIGALIKTGKIQFEEGYTVLVDAGMSMVSDPEKEPWTHQLIITKIKRALRQATPRQMKPLKQVHVVTENNKESEIIVTPKALSNAILNPPGILGQYVQHINKTSRYREPLLALAAAIPMLGAIKGHKIQTTEELRTNFYTTGIAPSGTGKDHARRINRRVLNASGLTELLGGEPASSSGMFKSLADGHGVRLLQIDEFGPFLKASMGAKAPSHVKNIAPLLMELMTSANDRFLGKEYVNHTGDRPRLDIDQPHLCIYGTTTASEFYGALSSGDALSGFLPRILFFEVETPSLSKNMDFCTEELPPDILEEIAKWRKQPKNIAPLGDLDMSINPKKIAFRADAQTRIDEFADEMRQLAFTAANKNTGRDAVYNRAAEHASKLALLVTDFDEVEISLKSVEWGIEIALYSSKLLCDSLESHIADNAYEANLKKVLAVLKDAGIWMTTTKLTQKTQFLNKRQREEILDSLIDAEQVEDRTVVTATNTATEYRFVKRAD